MVIPIYGILLYGLVSYVASIALLSVITGKGIRIRFLGGRQRPVNGIIARFLGALVSLILVLVIFKASQNYEELMFKFWMFIIGGFLLGIITFAFRINR
tara:strand:+ start:981 stop:1277 length:297 start_codon:yes stop_codon:yes gene_type:complete